MGARKHNTVTVKGLKDVIKTYIEANIPLFIHGTFGEGKSAITKQVAEKLGYEVVDVRISQVLPEDMGGIVFHGEVEDPDTGEKIVSSIRGVPDIIQTVWKVKRKTGKPVLLFMDEFNSGAPSVMAAAYSILLDREAAGFKLPEDTRIICAGNLEDDNSIVNEVPMAANNRMGHIWFNGPTLNEYMEYMAERGMHFSIIAFLKHNEQFLMGWFAGDSVVDKTEPEIPTPRTWEMLSQLFYVMEKNGTINDPIMRTAMISSVVGNKAAAKMSAVFEIISKISTYDDIIKNPETIKLPKDFKTKFIQVLSVASTFVNRVKQKGDEVFEKDFEKVEKYIARYDEDTTMMGMVYIINNIPEKYIDGEKFFKYLKISNEMEALRKK